MTDTDTHHRVLYSDKMLTRNIITEHNTKDSKLSMLVLFIDSTHGLQIKKQYESWV